MNLFLNKPNLDVQFVKTICDIKHMTFEILSALICSVVTQLFSHVYNFVLFF